MLMFTVSVVLKQRSRALSQNHSSSCTGWLDTVIIPLLSVRSYEGRLFVVTKDGACVQSLLISHVVPQNPPFLGTKSKTSSPSPQLLGIVQPTVHFDVRIAPHWTRTERSWGSLIGRMSMLQGSQHLFSCHARWNRCTSTQFRRPACSSEPGLGLSGIDRWWEVLLNGLRAVQGCQEHDRSHGSAGRDEWHRPWTPGQHAKSVLWQMEAWTHQHHKVPSSCGMLCKAHMSATCKCTVCPSCYNAAATCARMDGYRFSIIRNIDGSIA